MKPASRRTRTAIVLLLLAGLSLSTVADLSASEWQAEFEAGVAGVGYNDVRVPGDNGTEFSFVDDFATEAQPFWRARLTWQLAERHALSVLVAPLRFNVDGSFDRTVQFNGESFAAGVPIVGIYRFDSYRLTYRYRLVNSPNFTFGLGVTAKIRDAEIQVESDSVTVEKTNTGFVPLINFLADWSISDPVTLRLRGDALAAPQGRAEDVLVAVLYRVMPRLQLQAGYRLLEGGVDNDEVYNFTLVHYAVFGAILTL